MRRQSRREQLGFASLAGALAGMAPDLDVLIRSASDPLLAVEYHRHFTHALLFVPAGAFLIALLLWPWLRKRFSFARVYLWCFLGMLSHGLLDACTSYGTRLWWPVVPEPVAWDLISIIDPLFSGPALLLLLLGLGLRQLWPGRLALAWCMAWLALGAVQQHRALDLQQQLAQSRGDDATHGRVMPALGSLLLWRSVYLDGDEWVVDGLRPSLGRPAQVHIGGRLPRWLLEDNADASYQHDLQRFGSFTQGYMSRLQPDNTTVTDAVLRLGDVRYAALPHSTTSLWGLQLQPAQADQPLIWWNDWSERQAGLTPLWKQTIGAECNASDCIEMDHEQP